MEKVIKKPQKKNVTNDICIIGVGKFGSYLINNLTNHHKRLIAIDTNPIRIQAIKDKVDVAIVGDAANEEFIRNYGIQNIDTIIIGIGDNIESSLLVASILREYKHEKIICRSIHPSHEKILTLLGVAKIISPERQSAKFLADNILHPLIFNKSVTMNEFEKGFSVIRIVIRNTDYVNKPIREYSHFLKDHAVISLITRNKSSILPSGDTIIELNDIITFIGETHFLLRVIKTLSNKNEDIAIDPELEKEQQEKLDEEEFINVNNK